MPYVARGKCVYKKDGGKKVGCTKGPVKKYLAALEINAAESKTPSFKEFHEGMMTTAAGQQVAFDTQDSAATCEAEYATGQEDTDIGVVNDKADPQELIRDVINDIEELRQVHNWNQAVHGDIIQALADTINDAGIAPTDLLAAIGAPPDVQELYLTKARNDLKAMLNKPVEEDDNNPNGALPYGSSDAGITAGVNEGLFEIGEIVLDDPFGTGPKHYNGTRVPIEAASPEQALNKFVRMLASQHKIPTNPRILYRNAQENGAKIKPVTQQPVAKQEYWWDKY